MNTTVTAADPALVAIHRLFDDAIGPAFDLEDLEATLGSSNGIAVGRGAGADVTAAISAALRDAGLEGKGDGDLQGIAVLVSWPHSDGLFATIRAASSRVRREFGDSVSVIARSKHVAGIARVEVGVWARTT